MAKWLENTDVKKLLCYMFGVIVVMGMTLYQKDMYYLDDKLSDILTEVKEIKLEQSKQSEQFTADLDAVEEKEAADFRILKNRVHDVELKVYKLVRK